jgi:hypothetical protein
MAAGAVSSAQRAEALLAIARLTAPQEDLVAQAQKGLHEAANAMAQRENRPQDKVSALIGT